MDTHTVITIGDRVNSVNFWKHVMFSWPVNPGKYLPSFLLIVLIGLACAVAESPQNAAALATRTGIIVPLYSYPGQVWDDLVKEKNSHPLVPVVAIINPDSGPGVRDPNYVTGIKKLESAGILVLGYVYTQKTDVATIKNYVDDYKNWYNVSGIFFDGMSNVHGNEKFYANLSNYAKSQGLNYTVGNPGTDTLPSYIGTVDNLVFYDNKGLPLVSSFGTWHTNFTRNNFSIVSYGVNDINKTYVENVTKHVQYIYVTNSTLPNPFNTLPKYLDNLMSMVENDESNKTLPVFVTIKSYSDNGTSLNGLWIEVRSDKNSSSGFTPFSVAAVLGNNYTVTMSNFQNYTFDHWDDGTTNSTKTVVLDKNMTLSAYYNSSSNSVGFSHVQLTRGPYSALATGQYTNGDTPYLTVFPRLNLYDNSSHLIGTGLGSIWNIGAYDSKSFQILVNVSKAFESYAVVVDKAVSKNAVTDVSSLDMSKNLTGSSGTRMNTSNSLSCNCAPASTLGAQDMSSIEVTLAYVGGDRAYSSTMALKVYQDTNPTVYRDIESISENPFNLTSLPVNHKYKIEVYANGMYSSMGYVDLQKTPQQLTLNLPLPGGLQPSIFYSDGYTPIFNATVNVLSQDNKTWASSLTDSRGTTLRFWLEPTIIENNYFVVDVHISPHISYSFLPVLLHPGGSQDIKIITPWPAKVEDLFTVKIYDGQSNIVSPAKENLVVYLFDNNGNVVGQSQVNYRGEANFSNLKVGDYVIKAIDAKNNMEWGRSNVVIDGTKTSFAIFKNQTSLDMPN